MPSTLTISGLAASFGARPLFADLSAIVGPNAVVALVGPNGAGKSTLLRIVAGLHAPDTGEVRLSPPTSTVGYLPQSVPEASESILDYARRRTGVADADARFQAATQALADGRPGADDEYALALDRWLALGGADLDVRLAQTVATVGLDADLDRPLGALSGGQAARAALSSIVVSQFDVLLLDEPTNNLDATGIATVTEFIRRFEGPVLVASHDRALMDAVATSVIEIDSRQGTIETFKGGWSDYREAKDLARQHAQQEYEAYATRRDALADRATRMNSWADKGRADFRREQASTPAHLDRTGMEVKARRMDQRAATARAAAERLEAVDQPRKEWQLRYTIAEAAPSAEVVVTLDTVVAHAGDFAVGPVSTTVERGDRIALVGDNGSGKSTLLSAMLGRRPYDGRLVWGTRTEIGVIDQERTLVSGPRPLLDVVAEALDLSDAAEVRTLLAKFGLGAEHIGRPCETLSMGERTRAELAVLQGRAVNVVVLDEPTNHADVEAIEQLQPALESFGGTVLLVTHDRALADAVGLTTTWEFTRSGNRARVEVFRRD